jgi:predicted MFS family arabinose efflux permease
MALNSVEKKALSGLALLYASRMLGLFMVLPVLALYGQDLVGATPALLGVALGIYGLTQACLQIPFGAASDRFGRKPLIVTGLLIFLAGSIISALSSHVIGLILGRALQGAGAISSVVLALLADYTRPEERSKSMAVVGAVIGASFVLAVVLGPWLAGFAGLSGLFWFTAVLAVFGLLVLFRLPEIPPVQVHQERKFSISSLADVLKDRNVMVLSLGIFLLHMTMTALFTALPVELVQRGFEADDLGKVYAPVMILSFVFMMPLMMTAERKLAHVPLIRLAAILILLALLVLDFFDGVYVAAIALLIFFIGFNFIEASLPSLLSRKASQEVRGTAMGVFSTGQFVGAASGGMIGGWLYSNHVIAYVLWMGLAAQLIWVFSTLWLTPIANPGSTNG